MQAHHHPQVRVTNVLVASAAEPVGNIGCGPGWPPTAAPVLLNAGLQVCHIAPNFTLCGFGTEF